MNNDVVWQAISAVAGCITTAMAILWSNERKKGRRRSPDRVDALLDGYERLILDNDRQGRVIDDLEGLVNGLKIELNKSQGMIQLLREDLGEARQRAEQLQSELISIKGVA